MADIFEILHEDHMTLLTLFERLEREGENEEVEDLLKRTFKGHRAAEEETLYPMLEKDQSLAPLIRQAYIEHHAVNVLMTETRWMPTEHDDYRSRMTVLKEMVAHHIEKEEGPIFERARRILEPQAAEDMVLAFNEERHKAA
jgi:hemerythrin superfamily protein